MVEAVEERDYVGTLIVLSIDHEDTNVICTPTHPFWIVDEDTIQRPSPANLKAASENSFFGAKWVQAGDLKHKLTKRTNAGDKGNSRHYLKN